MAGTAKEELLEMPAGLDRSFPSVVLEFSSFALSARKRLNASELGVERTKSSRGCLSDSVEFDHRKSFVRSLHFPVFQPEPSLFYCIGPSEISFFHFLCFLQKGLRGGILRAHHSRPFSLSSMAATMSPLSRLACLPSSSASAPVTHEGHDDDAFIIFSLRRKRTSIRGKRRRRKEATKSVFPCFHHHGGPLIRVLGRQ